MLKAVLFDLDGVITDSAHYHFLAWKQLAEELSVEFDQAFNENLKGVSRMASLNLILKKGGLEQQYTEDEKAAMARKKNEFYKTLIEDITPDDILPGIKSFLIELKDHDIKTVITSASRNAQFIIDRLQLNGYFNHIVDAALVGRAKPAPDVFLAGAYMMKANPSECIGIEDAEAGIAAIKEAGMKAVGVGTAEKMKEADIILNSTSQLSMDKIQKLYHQP